MAYYPRLRDMREDHDLTQQKLAEYLGMPQPQYFRYEQGLRDIPTDILIQLAKLYNTTTDYLLGLTDDPVIPWRQGGASRTPPPTNSDQRAFQPLIQLDGQSGGEGDFHGVAGQVGQDAPAQGAD